MAALRARGLSEEALSAELDQYEREHHALARAVGSGDAEEVRRLVCAGADPNAVDLLGAPVLHAAAACGSVEIIELLPDRGVDVDVRDDFLNTALWHAANNAQRASVECLLARGADPTLRNDLGESPEDRADRGAADPTLVPLLRRAAASRT